MAGEASPTDGRFRRGVYVMLVVLGIFAASGPIAVRQARHEASAAREEAAGARMQVATLIAGQRAAAERDILAEQERAALLRRSQGLEQLLVALLAKTNDPQVRTAFEQYARAESPTPSPAPATPASPTPHPSRQPTPKPSPSVSAQPSPSPTCTRLPILGCVGR